MNHPVPGPLFDRTHLVHTRRELLRAGWTDGRIRHALTTGAVTACGVLSVSEERDTDGYTLSLYRMTCEKVIYEDR